MLINALLYLTFFFFSFGQLARISLLNQQINFYLYELPMAMTLVIIFFKSGFKPLIKSVGRVRIVYIFFGYLLLTYLLGITKYDWQQNIIAFLYPSRLIFYWLYFVYAYKFIKKRQIFLFILMTIIASVLQFFFYPDLRNLIYLGWDPHFHRMFGVFLDTSIAGAIYGLILLYLLFNRHSGKERSDASRINNRFWASQNDLLLFIIFLFIILTYSRSLYIIFLLTIFWYFLLRQKFKLFLAITLIFLSLIMFIPTDFGKGVELNRVFSVKSRLADYNEAFTVWSKNPLLGIGYNRIRNTRATIMNIYPSHAKASYSSSYLIILVTGGTIGLILFLFMLYRLLMLGNASGLYVLFLGLLSFTDNILLHPFIMFLFGSILLVNNRDAF